MRGIIAEQLGTDLEKVSPDSKFVDLGADSLDTVEIMMALEEKFDLQLDEEGAEKISTVQVSMQHSAVQPLHLARHKVLWARQITAGTTSAFLHCSCDLIPGFVCILRRTSSNVLYGVPQVAA